MPEKVERCVKSILEDNPEYSDSRAWAICTAQFEAGTDSPEVHALEETELMAEALDELCERRPEWNRYESEYGVAWIGQQSGSTVFQAVEQEAPEDITAQSMAEFVSSHWDGADTADVLEALDDIGEWAGEVDLRELASLVADATDRSTGDVLESFEQEADREEVSFRGLSTEAVADIEDRYNVTVLE